ncbi:MAG TPA: hypothetical protein VFS02_06975 [Telluria sp.]|nr:hypothetical protein [Telluria sp.]
MREDDGIVANVLKTVILANAGIQVCDPATGPGGHYEFPHKHPTVAFGLELVCDASRASDIRTRIFFLPELQSS